MPDAPAESGSDRRVARIALRIDLFDRLTAAQGLTSDVDRARAIGVDRNTLGRMRRRQHSPRLEVAMQMAERLGTTVDALFERVSA